MNQEQNKTESGRFSVRDLMLVVFGSSVLIAFVTLASRETNRPVLMTIIYSLPIISGMTGMLLEQFKGGLVGALIGGWLLGLAVILLEVH